MMPTPGEPWEVLTWSTRISFIDRAFGMNFPAKSQAINNKVAAARSREDGDRHYGQRSSADKGDESGAEGVSHDLENIGEIFGLKQDNVPDIQLPGKERGA